MAGDHLRIPPRPLEHQAAAAHLAASPDPARLLGPARGPQRRLRDALLATFAYAETGCGRYLALAAVGVAGLLGVPSLGLYLLLRGQLGPALRRPVFWLAGVGALAAPALYYSAARAGVYRFGRASAVVLASL